MAHTRYVSTNSTSTSSTSEVRIRVSEMKLPAKQSFWSKMTDPINFWGNATFVYDAVREVAVNVSSTANTFFTSTIPPAVSAAIYIVPSFAMFLPRMISSCRKRYSNRSDHQVDDTDDAEEQAEFMHQLEGVIKHDSQLKAICENPESLTPTNSLASQRRLIVRTIQATNRFGEQKTQELDRLNLMINTFYLAARPFRGAMAIAQLYDLASKDANDQVTTWTDGLYNVLTLLYAVVALWQSRRCGRRKTALRLPAAAFFTPRHDELGSDSKTPIDDSWSAEYELERATENLTEGSSLSESSTGDAEGPIDSLFPLRQSLLTISSPGVVSDEKKTSQSSASSSHYSPSSPTLFPFKSSVGQSAAKPLKQLISTPNERVGSSFSRNLSSA